MATIGAKKIGTPPPVKLELDLDLVRQLRRPAADRGLSVAGLARRLLDTIAADGLVGAVLDDKDRDEPQAGKHGAG